MKYLLWLLKAAIFFTLFAFALNNQQDATVHFFFGTHWRAPLVLVVLAAFARRPGRRRAGHGAAAGGSTAAPRPLPRAARSGTTPQHRTASARPPAARMDFDLSWLLLGPADRLRAGLAGLAPGPAPAAHREPAGAQGLLSRPELPAQRAAGPGHRRLHRGGAERPRHLGAALRAGQPVPPPRRVRARRARARAPAVARRPEPRRPPPRPARAGAGLPEGRPARPRRGGAAQAGRHALRRTRRCWRCWPSTSARATGRRPPRSRSKLDASGHGSFTGRRRTTCASRPPARRRDAGRAAAAARPCKIAPGAPRARHRTGGAAAPRRRRRRRLRARCRELAQARRRPPCPWWPSR